MPLDRRLPEEAWAWVDSHLHAQAAVRLPVTDAAGHALAHPLVAPTDLPLEALAAGDGYAVVAEATAGAGPYN
ncbi:MAG: hypothetical protein WBG92_20210, partial [Thiohalocapsa sp.]